MVHFLGRSSNNNACTGSSESFQCLLTCLGVFPAAVTVFFYSLLTLAHVLSEINLLCLHSILSDFNFLLKDFRERRREGEREREKHLHARDTSIIASHRPPPAPDGDLARNPGMWSDWESNP